MNVARQVLYFQGLVLGLAGLPLGCLQLTPDFLNLIQRFPGLVLGFGQVKEVAFLFAPPQPIEPHSDQQGDQLDFGHLQIGFGVAMIVGQNFPFLNAMPGVHKNDLPARRVVSSVPSGGTG